MKKIISQRYTPHCLAFCECGWQDGADRDDKKERQRVRNNLFRHLRKTGHAGQVETGLCSQYRVIEQK